MQGSEAPSFTLTSLLAQTGIDGPYSLLMDIEGGESDVLMNDEKVLSHCERMIVELHDSRPTAVNPWGRSVAHCLDRLHDLGFRIIDRGRGAVYALARQD